MDVCMVRMYINYRRVGILTANRKKKMLELRAQWKWEWRVCWGRKKRGRGKVVLGSRLWRLSPGFICPKLLWSC